MAKHQHDDLGEQSEDVVQIGNELVTYLDTHCTCGAVVARDVTNRQALN